MKDEMKNIVERLKEVRTAIEYERNKANDMAEPLPITPGAGVGPFN